MICHFIVWFLNQHLESKKLHYFKHDEKIMYLSLKLGKPVMFSIGQKPFKNQTK
jgi:hypothetical protein